MNEVNLDKRTLLMIGTGLASLAGLVIFSTYTTLQSKKATEQLLNKLEEANIPSSIVDKSGGIEESQISEPLGNNWFRTKVRKRFLTG